MGLVDVELMMQEPRTKILKLVPFGVFISKQRSSPHSRP